MTTRTMLGAAALSGCAADVVVAEECAVRIEEVYSVGGESDASYALVPGKKYDWLEVRNVTGASVGLGRYVIGLDADDATQLEPRSLGPDEREVIIASQYGELGFDINNDLGGALTLALAEGEPSDVCQEVFVGDQHVNSSWSWVDPDWCHAAPTPGGPNRCF